MPLLLYHITGYASLCDNRKSVKVPVIAEKTKKCKTRIKDANASPCLTIHLPEIMKLMLMDRS